MQRSLQTESLRVAKERKIGNKREVATVCRRRYILLLVKLSRREHTKGTLLLLTKIKILSVSLHSITTYSYVLLNQLRSIPSPLLNKWFIKVNLFFCTIYTKTSTLSTFLCGTELCYARPKRILKYFMYPKTQKSKSRQPLYIRNRITWVQLERNIMYKNEALTQTLSSKCDEVYSMNLLAC